MSARSSSEGSPERGGEVGPSQGSSPAGHVDATRTLRAAAEQPFDPVESMRILNEPTRLRERLEPDARLIFGAWGLAWLIGCLTLYLTVPAAAVSPRPWAFGVFAGCLAAAAVFTLVHIIRRSTGLGEASATSGTIYGYAWLVARIAVGMLLGAVAAHLAMQRARRAGA